MLMFTYLEVSTPLVGPWIGKKAMGKHYWGNWVILNMDVIRC